MSFLSGLSWSSAVLILFILVAAFKFIEITWITPKRFEAYFMAQGIPTTGYRYIVGHLPEVRHYKRTDQSWRFAMESTEKLGRIFISFFGPFPRIVLNSPSHLQDVLVKKAHCYSKPDVTVRALSPLLGQGLVTSEGELWKKQRTTINPAFHFVNLKAMISLMCSSTAQAISNWDQKVNVASDGSFELEIHKEFSSLTLDIIASTSFGSSFRDNPKDAEAIYSAFTRVLSAMMKRNFSLVLFFPILRDLPILYKREVDQGIALIEEVAFRILSDRRAGKNVSLCEGRDLLDLLLEARDTEGQPMPEQQIKDELMTFVLAGHETTSNLLVWLCYDLCLHPEVQERCRQEVDKVLPEKSSANYESLKQLRYVDAVVDETLRFHPPVSIIARQATADHVLNGVDKNGQPLDLTVPKGTSVQIHIRMIHRDPGYWKDPNTYDPARFLGAAADEDDPQSKPRFAPCSFLPFSAGPRSCIGSQFAKLEAKVIISLLLQRFRLELVPGQKIVEDVAVTLRPKYGMHVRLIRRSDQ